MTYVLGLIIAVIFGYLIYTNLQSVDPENEAAVREIVELHRQREQISTDEVLEVLQSHGRNRTQGSQVARMLLVRLKKVGKQDNDRIHAMPAIRLAVARLPETVDGRDK